MSMLFFLKPFQQMDTYFPFAGEAYDLPSEKKKKKKRRVYKVKTRARSIVAKELSSELEARRHIETEFRQEMMRVRAEKKKQQLKQVIFIAQMLRDQNEEFYT